MLKNLKANIKELAYSAVTIAEESLTTATGGEKKIAAIEYIIAMVPIPFFLKGVVSVILSKFIDEAIETAVEYMNKIKNAEE